MNFMTVFLKSGYKTIMYIAMYSTHNEGKSVVAERFIKKTCILINQMI